MPRDEPEGTNSNYSQIKNLRGWLLLGLLTIMPLFYWYNLRYFVSIPKATLFWLISLFLLGQWVAESISQSTFKFTISTLDIFLVSFAVLVVLSTATSIHIPTSILGYYGQLNGLLTFLACLVVFYSTRSINWHTQGKVFVAMLSISMVVAWLGILAFLGMNLLPEGLGVKYGGASSTFGNPTFLAGYAVLVLPLAFALLLSKKSITMRVFALLATTSLTLVLFFTRCRAAWLATIIVLFALLLLFFANKKPQKKTVVSIGVLIIVVLTVILTTYAFRSDLTNQVTSKILNVSNARVRLKAWTNMAVSIEHRPFLGSGPGMVRFIYDRYGSLKLNQLAPGETMADAHNFEMNIAISSGILALFLFLCFFLSLLGQSMAEIKRKSGSVVSYTFPLAVIGYFIYLQFSPNSVAVDPLWWVFIGIAASFIQPEQKKQIILKVGSPRSISLCAVGLVALLILATLSALPFFADLHFYQADQIKSIPEYETSIRLNPYVADYYRDFAKLLVKEATSTNNKAQFNQAISVLKQSIAMNPQSEESYLALGEAYIDGGMAWNNKSYFSAASQALKQALVRRPFDYQAYYLLGYQYLKAGNFRQAELALNKSLKIYPRNSFAWFALAECYERTGNKKKALQVYSKVYRLNPELFKKLGN